jgi:hypothetical protein
MPKLLAVSLVGDFKHALELRRVSRWDLDLGRGFDGAGALAVGCWLRRRGRIDG